EVGEVVAVVARRARRAAELARIDVLAVLRVEVFDHGIDVLILVAGLEAVTPKEERVIDARVDDGRVLVLRVAVLPAQALVTADALRIEPARDARVGGQPRNAVKSLHVRPAQSGRLFA